MKKEGLLNPQILSAIAGVGHTEYLVIADAGLPIPPGTPVIDISLIRGVPDFGVVLDSVLGEMVVESYLLAEEIVEQNTESYNMVCMALSKMPFQHVPHEAFKRMAAKAKAVIRTGETTPYSNIILVAGVDF